MKNNSNKTKPTTLIPPTPLIPADMEETDMEETSLLDRELAAIAGHVNPVGRLVLAEKLENWASQLRLSAEWHLAAAPLFLN
jgi:hypothetical protein